MHRFFGSLQKPRQLGEVALLSERNHVFLLLQLFAVVQRDPAGSGFQLAPHRGAGPLALAYDSVNSRSNKAVRRILRAGTFTDVKVLDLHSDTVWRGIKEIYTDLINRHISDPEQQLKVFDKNSVYLPTKKIGKNNPKAAEIEADNTARQEWNRTADMALLSGISEAKILEVKQTEIHEKASQSIKSKGWLPNLFRGIVAKAKDFLQNLIREKDMPPKPTLDIDMAEFRHMRNLMIKVQDKAKEIKNLQDKVLPHLKQQLADTKGLFKGKERKALEVKIKETEVEIADRLDKIPDTLKADGYPDVQVFMRTFREMESVVEQYNRDLAEWEYQVSRKPTAATKEQHRPPERQSVLKHLREIQERNKQQPPQRQYKKSIDRDSR